MKKIAILSLAIAAQSMSAAAHTPSRKCLAGMRTALIAGHFTGPLICKKSDATFNFMGRTTGLKYLIYDYRYRFMPKDGNIMHGGQKLVVFRENKYVGQYALSPPPYTNVIVHRSSVVLKIEETGEKVELDFSKNPPKEVLINGEIETFYR